ncbi:glutamate-cysteine ligase family protein [Streptomyces sp. MW-W600-10]|uniref:glutamate-cysteine ligase family protein n=1 Tax=Streptomyces sp. MW-W600-10 TaxID=2829819 RepID=UPI0035ABB30B
MRASFRTAPGTTRGTNDAPWWVPAAGRSSPRPVRPGAQGPASRTTLREKMRGPRCPAILGAPGHRPECAARRGAAEAPPVMCDPPERSPFRQGRDSGYSGYRSQVWGRWPSAGPVDGHRTGRGVPRPGAVPGGRRRTG